MLFGLFTYDDGPSRADLDAENTRLRAMLDLSRYQVRECIIRLADGRAKLQAAQSETSILRDKLVELRPYLVAAARGSSLQAKGDLTALDAVLAMIPDTTKPNEFGYDSIRRHTLFDGPEPRIGSTLRIKLPQD